FILDSDIRRIPVARRLGIILISQIVGLFSGLRVSDAQSGYRCYDSKAIELILPETNGMSASTELLVSASRAGLTIAEVPVSVEYQGIRKPSQDPLTHFLEVLVRTMASSLRLRWSTNVRETVDPLVM